MTDELVGEGGFPLRIQPAAALRPGRSDGRNLLIVWFARKSFYWLFFLGMGMGLTAATLERQDPDFAVDWTSPSSVESGLVSPWALLVVAIMLRFVVAWTALAMAFFGAIPGLMTAIIIVGGVLSGVFTVTESGAFGALYAFVVTLVVYRSITWTNFKTAVIQSVRTTSMVMILIACAGAFAYMLTFYRVPKQTVEFLTGLTDNPILILLMINAMLLLLGMIMDMAALILICTPIFLPVMNALGIDPLQFGMILLVNLGLGLCTPPVGSCLFVGCAVGKLPMEKAVRTIWPFYLAIFVALMLTTFIPAISLTLPGLIG